MAVREIRLFGDPVLKSATESVDATSDRARDVVSDLLDTVALPGRAGVAANQIGVGLSAFSYNIDGDIGYIINPSELEVWGEEEEVPEGCLSVPGLTFPRRRFTHARVTGDTLEGERVVVEGEGLMAQALQHETDHLRGVLYFEGLDPEFKREALKAIRASEWFA